MVLPWSVRTRSLLSTSRLAPELIRRDFMPRVGATGRDIIAAETPEEVKALVGGSDAPTTIPQGALAGSDGVKATRGEDGTITVSLADKGVTAAKLADGVIPAAPTWATLTGKPAAAAAKADLTATTTAADVNAILAVLRAWGLIAAK